MAEQDKEASMSYLDMSDEDIANVDVSTLNQTSVSTEVTTQEDVSDETLSEEGSDEERTDEETSGSGQGSGLLEEVAEDAADSDEEKESTSKEAAPDTAKEATDEADTFDYKAEYNRLITPFKANGRDITVKGVDDAISLMQMGANYNKKMAALKPNLRLMKMLENNGLLNEAKIGHFIDLEKKNPGAINKMMQDSGLDPLEMDADKASEYKPTAYAVDDKEIELDTVLDDLHDTPTYSRMLDIVSNKWDGPSKNAIANTPQLLKVINDHVQSGIYDLISKEVENERTFGRLNGMSDIEAYRQVGDAIQARGGFSHLSNQGQQIQPKPVVVQPKPKMGNEDKIREKKRAAGSVRSASASKEVAADFNPLALSDAEFGNLVNNKFL